jgi:hypothetical protein
MNNKGQLELNWAALGLAVLGAFFSFKYVDYLGTGAGAGTKIITSVLTLVIGYIVAHLILER